MPSAAQAFGFGAPVIQSHLDEPLRIHLPIILNQNEVLSQIFIHLAKPDVYKQWGLTPYIDVSQLHLLIHNEQKNHPYLEILSYQPMSMALVSFILEAKQNKHYFYKQIKVLLDPASYVSAQEHYTQHEQVLHLPVKPTTAKHKHVKDDKPQRVHDEDWARTWRYGPVQSGDSLSTIAYRLRKDKRYSNRMVMRALYLLNPDAFENGDMNQLKAGVFLNVPHAKALKVLLSQAIQEPTKKKNAKPHPKIVASPKKTSLHYVGHITSSIDTHSISEAPVTIPQAKVVQDIQTVKQRLDAMYKKNMASHIRLDGVDLALKKIQNDVDGLKQEVTQANQNQLA